MTAYKDLSARLAELTRWASSGKWGQFNPRFMDEAKYAAQRDWDTSHHLSAVFMGERKRICEWKHADDAAFAEVLVNAYRSGQLITLAEHDAAVQAAVAKAVEAERDACAEILDNEAADYEADAKRYRGGSDPHHYRRNKADAARKYAAAIRSRGVAG